MQALAASCEELRARTGNPPLDVRQRIIAQYSSYNIIASGVTTMGNYLQFTTFKQNRNLKIKNLET